MMNETKSLQRIYGIDLIKLLILFPIIYFHINEFIFGTNAFPLGDETILYEFFYPYSAFMAFSGVALVFLSFFLFGFKKSDTNAMLKLVPIFIIGQFLFNKIFNTSPYWYSFEWDIYSYLACSIFFLIILNKLPSRLLKTIVLGVLFIVPYEDFLNPSIAQNPILFPYCADNSVITWPLIPWIGLPALGYLIGETFRTSSKEKISSRELFVWLFAVGLCLPFLGAYEGAPVGDDFYCFVFDKSKLVLLAHMLPITFLVRLSLIENINLKLAKNRFVLILSKTMWVKKLWLCYIIHGVLLGIISNFSLSFFKNPELFDAFFVIIIPLTDLICRVILMIKYRVSKA